jgi:hypothetical protein
MKTAPNFAIGISGTKPLYPLPTISHFTTKTITVQTSSGAKTAMEITIHGANFAIRAVDPDVIVNGIPLVHFRTANDFQSITGYFLGTLSQPIYSVIVDYGGGVRGEWTGVAGSAGGHRRARLLRILLWLLLLLLLLAVVVLALGGISLSGLGWALLIGAVVLNIVALLIVWG